MVCQTEFCGAGGERAEKSFLVLRLCGEKELLLVYGQELLCSTMFGRAPREARAKALLRALPNGPKFLISLFAAIA